MAGVDVVISKKTIAAINLMPDPEGLAGWTGQAGTGGVVAQDYQTNGPWVNGDAPPSYVTTATRTRWTTAQTGTSTTPAAWGPMIPVTPGDVYDLQVRVTQGTGANRHFSAYARFFDNTGTFVTSTLGADQSISAAGVWVNLVETVTVPSGVAFMSIGWEAVSATSALMAIGDTVYCTAIAIISDAYTYTGDFFDGNTPNSGDASYGFFSYGGLTQSRYTVSIPAPQWNTIDYSVEEDATSLDPTDSSGGSPVFSVDTNLFQGDKQLISRTIELSDGARGAVVGRITGLSSKGNGTLSIAGVTSMGLLNTIVNATPYAGTLSAAFGYYLSLVGLTTSDYQVDSTIASRSVAFPGWTANLQDQMKALCAGQQIEMSYVDSQLILRPTRQNVAQVYRDSAFDWSLDTSQQAQQVSAFYYQGISQTSKLAYPTQQPDHGADIQQVGDGQQITVNIDLGPLQDDGTGVGVSLISVDQPYPVDGILEDILTYTGTSGYSIVDSNNKIYPAAQWSSKGGSIIATVDADSNGLTLLITGPVDSLGPYRIAGTSDAGESFYNTLRLTGTGIFYDKQLWTVPTGLTSIDTNTVSGTVVDNFAINTIGDANSAILSSLRNAQGPSQSITVSTGSINTSGVSNEYTLITFAQWDAIWGGGTFAAWDAAWAGGTFDTYDQYLFSLVRGKFANQAFGNTGGARVWNDNCFYRISTSTLTESGVKYTAIADNQFQDWDNVWGGKTFAQWDAIWGGMRFMEYTPTLLSPGDPAVIDTYLDPTSRQDIADSKGLGYSHQPNLQQWQRANTTPTPFGYGNGGYGVNPYGL